ncbi:MAG: tripartite tricarboxylate transporter substrate binding protein [Rhodospirillales bacterium]|jgi:tripartite-type tricarboxylate transporter receptor subunit TctC|nr:tripartite tricarboxylate transporter substrate binding protein [Rhodospirillales bacterium]
MSRTRSLLSGIAACLLIASTGAIAASYPERPVTVIVPFNPGGGTDQQARLIEEAFKTEFGQPLVFVYKPGANGAIGATELAKAKPDGYTIAVYTFPLMVMNALTGAGQYGLEDFDYLGVASVDEVVLVTRRDGELSSFAALVEAAKAKPGKLSIGSVENLGPTHMAALAFKELGVDVNVVPFPGGAQGLTAVLGGHIDALFALHGAVRSSETKLTYLGMARSDRHAASPNIPTLKENGYDVKSSAARIWIAPKGLPTEINERLVEGLRKIYAIDDVKTRHEKVSQIIDFSGGKELKGLIDDFLPNAKMLVEKYGK